MTKNQKIEMGVVVALGALLLFLWWEKRSSGVAPVQTSNGLIGPFSMPAITTANVSVPSVQSAPDFEALVSALGVPTQTSLPGQVAFDVPSFSTGTGQNSTPMPFSVYTPSAGCTGGCAGSSVQLGPQESATLAAPAPRY